MPKFCRKLENFEISAKWRISEIFFVQIGKKVDQFRLGVLKEGIIGCDAEVQKIFQSAVEKIKKSEKFANVQEISIPVQKDGNETKNFFRNQIFLIKIF